MSSRLNRIGRFAARRPLVVIGCWILLALVVVTAAAGLGRPLKDVMEVPGSGSQRAAQLLARAGSAEAGVSARIVMTPRADGSTFADPDVRRAAAQVRVALAGLPKVRTTSDPLDRVSTDGRVAIAELRYPPVTELGGADLDRLNALIAREEAATVGRLLRIEAGGEFFFVLAQPEGQPGELVGVAIAAIILLIAFGSVVAAGMPILIALAGLGVGVTALPLVGRVVEFPSGAVAIAAMVGLGVGIDYALLVVSRHRQHLAEGRPVVDAVGDAIGTAGRSVVSAGAVVLTSILGLAVAGLPFVTAAGIGMALVVGLMVTAAITLLPAVLGLLGHRIERLSVHRRDRAEVTSASRWERWGRHVTRHPVAYLVTGVVVLVALAAPAAALRMGVPDEGTLPESRTERRAHDLVAGGFGPGANGPIIVAVEGSAGARGVSRLRSALEDDPGIAELAPTVGGDGVEAAAIVATPTTAPHDPVTRATIARLRERVIPAAVAGTGARASVGGQTAAMADMSGRVQDRLPWFIAAVVGCSMLLLMVVFRSVVVPAKAAILNLLSIGAAYGVLVAVFQWGWGASAIGLESTVPILSFIPMFMFAIVFGLSMDYEVFMLSSVREHVTATGDGREAVVRGMASTGRVITSAAMIMVVVFLGFALGDDPVTKMMGIGLGTAILVDATIVRMLLLPAAVTLMGSANWWMPRWLDRLLPGARA